MVIANNITKSYGEKAVLSDLSFSLPSTGIFLVTGVSGIGKTTLLRIIAGLEEPDSGTIKIDGKISVVFQENRLFPWLTLRENVLLTAISSDIADKHIKSLGLSADANLYPKEMSGGMQRRTEIARALSAEFDILLLDEPFAGLDEENAKSAMLLFENIAKTKCVVLISHDDRFLIDNPKGKIVIE